MQSSFADPPLGQDDAEKYAQCLGMEPKSKPQEQFKAAAFCVYARNSFMLEAAYHGLDSEAFSAETKDGCSLARENDNDPWRLTGKLKFNAESTELDLDPKRSMKSTAQSEFGRCLLAETCLRSPRLLLLPRPGRYRLCVL